ncbi:hypothetical protein DL769_003211 [Monosporascus sp. CRB-8-3]|nr:hypothetical protein DL769_003211 [Monosporascus sp. CRB-8-3]
MSRWSNNDDEPDPFTSGGVWGIDINYNEQADPSASYGTGGVYDPYGHNQDQIMSISGQHLDQSMQAQYPSAPIDFSQIQNGGDSSL